MITSVGSTNCSWNSSTARASHWKGVSLAIGCQWGCHTSCCTHRSSQILEVWGCQGIRASNDKCVHINSKLEIQYYDNYFYFCSWVSAFCFHMHLPNCIAYLKCLTWFAKTKYVLPNPMQQGKCSNSKCDLKLYIMGNFNIF